MSTQHTALHWIALGLVAATPFVSGCSDDEEDGGASGNSTQSGSGASGSGASGSGASGSGASGSGASGSGASGSGASGGGAAGGAGGSGAAGGSGGAGQGGAGGGPGGSGQGGAMMSGNLDCNPPSGSPPALKLTEVASGLSSPLLIKGAPGDDQRLYIIERNGRIKILQNGQVLATPFLDIATEVQGGGEQGLLGLAFHPGYAQNGRFFVHYSSEIGDGDTTIEEYVRSNDPAVADPTPVKTLLTVDQPYGNHNGGSIEFGFDGMLYIFLGDGGDGGDPGNRAQNLESLLGKVLRLDVDGSPYSIPPGNITTGKDEVWDYGLRNPYRASFDACTGDLYIGDVGQNAWEEIDVEPAGQGNRNYGWRRKEGNSCYNPSSGCDIPGLTAPAVAYDNDSGMAVIGGYVYRGSKMPGLRGTYFYGDTGTGQIWSFVWSGGQATAQTQHTSDLNSFGISISSFGQDNDGEVYLVHLGGSIYRIDAE
jgi:glucose/arabinose dehydrogenase